MILLVVRKTDEIPSPKTESEPSKNVDTGLRSWLQISTDFEKFQLISWLAIRVQYLYNICTHVRTQVMCLDFLQECLANIVR